MAVPQKFTVAWMVEQLRSGGMRITRGRRNILEVLFRSDRPLSLIEIQEKAGKLGKDAPDYATVFRMMTALEELHLAHKVNLQKSCSYFELNDPARHYDHLVCQDCGKVIVLDIPCPVEKAEKFIENEFGFSKLSHSLEFFGQCPDCGTASVDTVNAEAPSAGSLSSNRRH